VAGYPPLPGKEAKVTELSDCQGCPALGDFCEGDVEHAARCREMAGWPEAVGGLALDVPLAPQPPFKLPPFLPQLLNGLEVPAMIAREPGVAVGIAKALTPQGKVSRRAVPERYGTQSLRAQWGIAEETLLLCMGNTMDSTLEVLWRAQDQENIWSRLQGLGFDAATSLNFSIYLDRPRLEHLVNIKRSWLTVKRMQEMCRLIPIPHLQWGALRDLERQIDYAQSQGFHTLTLNLQMFKRQGWDTVLDGIAAIQEQAPGLRFLIAGVAGLKRLSELVEMLPNASFTNTTAHYLAQRYVRLQHHGGIRLIKEPVDGHPDVILAENVRLYREFLAEARGDTAQESPARSRPRPSTPPVAAMLQKEFGFDPGAALDAEELLVTDEAILGAFLNWADTGELERDFQGSFPNWACSDCVAHPTLGELLDAGADPVEAFLYLGHLAQQVDEEIEVYAGQDGY
jgi:hypothetical protein